MKKLILISAFFPILCSAQKKSDSTRVIKYQYISIDSLTQQQFDTLQYVMGKTNAEMQIGIAGIGIFNNHARLITVYGDTTKKK